ncbi:MAG TPA: hemerythrin domain-containing protein [Nitriliruptorales bacterium]|nr:hemerythrin domain-containing protein [Nitriliruptorales bacterium]
MPRDIVDAILEDHDVVRQLFAQLEETPPEERGDLFERIVYELARHEAAEESIVHPTLRDEVTGGEAVAAEVLEEESEAEQLMADMEGMAPTGEEFLQAFRRLRDDVLEHAEHEERDEHPRLRQELSQQRLQEMAEGFAELKENAPTRPHPKTPQTPEVRATVGPIAAVFDRARDKVREVLSR